MSLRQLVVTQAVGNGFNCCCCLVLHHRLSLPTEGLGRAWLVAQSRFREEHGVKRSALVFRRNPLIPKAPPHRSRLMLLGKRMR